LPVAVTPDDLARIEAALVALQRDVTRLHHTIAYYMVFWAVVLIVLAVRSC